MRPAGRSRTWVATIAVGVLFAQAGGMAHRALVAHARCEHGELVDADDVALAPDAHQPPKAGVGAGSPAVGLASDHQHCLVQIHARTALALRSSSLLLPAPAPSIGGPATPPVLAAQRDRYRLVPKQSPPA